MKLEQAQKIAELLKRDLEPYTNRIEIGGSIRRKKPEVKDIELVCIPTIATVESKQTDLFGGFRTEKVNLLFGRIASRYQVVKMGDRYTQMQVGIGGDDHIKVDVFTAMPETWGYIFLLRTGPAEFSKWVVTELKRRGFTPKGGEILHGAFVASTPTEQSVFNLLGIDWIEPEYRFKDVMWK